MESCVRTYLELAKGVGYYEILKPSETPFFAEDHKLADSCRPQNYGHYVECPYCKFTFGPNLDLYKDGKFVGQHL
eukprot:3991078-Karenia_brevis.AAC.1